MSRRKRLALMTKKQTVTMPTETHPNLQGRIRRRTYKLMSNAGRDLND
jgi:hypothetical protein